MKTVLAAIAVGLAVWTIIAKLLVPPSPSRGENAIVYATNSTPARADQIAAFNQANPTSKSLRISPTSATSAN